MSMHDISNNDDTIDLRDVIARVEELREEREALVESITEVREGFGPEENMSELADLLAPHVGALADWDEENGEELRTLETLLETFKGYGGDEQWEGDWYPVTLIRDSYFVEYAQELAEDIGSLSKEMTWPHNCIDWERAARELQMDYTAGDFGGVTYWAR